ncbi:unnamed protein product [Meloidogyne enterolobii]|uniref:Uncharacterized protein n=1 Tax=Meloidogyne enterolobii TaxID=390850 RepID=A0ACB1A3D6_MELEN
MTLIITIFICLLILKSFDLIKADSVTCETHIPTPTFTEENGIDTKLPRRRATGLGYWDFYTQIPERSCVGRRATGLGYWDFYTQIPERSCVGHFGLHAGENIAGSVTVKDKRCFDRLVMQIERKSTTEKFDVFQCRKCIFNSCWLGNRILHEQRTYLTNLRSY